MAGDKYKGITVEIGADVSGLSKALRLIDKEIKGTQSQLREVEKLLKLDPKNTTLLAQKQQLLAGAIEDTKTKLETLKKAEERAQDQFKKGEISQEQYNALQREIVDTEQKLKALTKEQQRFGSVASQQLAAVGKDFQKVGGQIEAAGKKMSVVSGVIAAGAVVATKAAVEYEDAFAGVRKTVDATEAEYQALSDGITEMSNRLPQSASEIAGVMEVAGQLGVRGVDNLLSFTETMVMLGDATNMSSEDAATAIARMMNIMGTAEGDVSRMGASIVALGNNFATTESEIVNMATGLAAGGKIAGLTEPQILALATAMSSVGIEAQAGSTAMTQTLTEMEKAVAGGGESLEQFAAVAGMTSEEFAQSWESDPMTALTSFIGGLGKLEDQGGNATLVLDEMGLSGIRQANMLKSLSLASDMMSSAVDTASTSWSENSALTTEAEKRYATLASQIEIAKNNLTNLAKDIGSYLMPIVIKITEKVKVFTDWFGKLDEKQKKTILTIAAIVAAIGPLLIIVGKLTTGLGGLLTFIPKIVGAFGGIKAALTALSGPVGIIIAAVAALIAIFIHLWNTNEGFRDAVTKIWEALKQTIGAAISAIVTVFQTIINSLRQIWNENEGLRNAVTVIWEVIKTVISAVVDILIWLLGTALPAAINFLVSIFQALWNAVVAVWTGISTAVSAVVNAIVTFFTATVPNAIQSLAQAFVNLRNSIAERVQAIKDSIVNGIQKAIDWIKSLPAQAVQWGRDFIEGLKAGIMERVNSIVDAVKGIGDKIRSFLHFSRPDEGPLRDYETWMPDFMSGLARGIKNSTWMLDDALAGVTSRMGGIVVGAKVNGVDTETSGSGAPGGSETIAGSFVQNVNVYSPTQLSPAETARQTRNATRLLIAKVVQ